MKICIDPLLDFSRIEQRQTHDNNDIFYNMRYHFLFQFLPAINKAMGSTVLHVSVCYQQEWCHTPRTIPRGPYPRDLSPPLGPEPPLGTATLEPDTPWDHTPHFTPLPRTTKRVVRFLLECFLFGFIKSPLSQ